VLYVAEYKSINGNTSTRTSLSLVSISDILIFVVKKKKKEIAHLDIHVWLLRLCPLTVNFLFYKARNVLAQKGAHVSLG